MAPVAPKLITNAAFNFLVAPQVTLQTTLGAVVLELNPEQAPVTVANMLAYANSGFYDGTLFHRVIYGFMVQGGGFNTGLAYKPPTYSPIVLESNNGLSNLRGTIAMARTSVADSATSQFFINQVDNVFLDYASSNAPGYAVFGKVLTGMAVVDSIASVANRTVGPYGNVPYTDINITAAVQSVAGSSITNNGTLTIGDVAAGAQWAYSLNGGENWTLGSGATLVLPEGNYAANAIQVVQQDAFGNVSASAGKLTSAVVVDTTAPTVSSFGPAQAVHGLLPSNNVEITFSEAVALGSGRITLQTQNGGVVESFDVASSPRISISGNTLIIDPSKDLSQGTAYTLTLETTSVQDLAGTPFGGERSHGFASWIDPVNPSAPVGQSVNLLAYSWKAHTLLSGVDIGGVGRLASTDAAGGARFAEVAEAQVALSASRPIPTAESAATASAVNLQDAVAILKMVVGLDVNGSGKALSPYQALAADFDGNGAVGLTDAIGVLRHVVGLASPDTTWHFLHEADASVPSIRTTGLVSPPAIDVTLGAASVVQVGLVGYLSGDVDGSYAGAIGALTLDASQPDYFLNLSAATGLSLSQFGVYP